MKLPVIAEKINDKVTAVTFNQAMRTGEILGTIMLPQNLSVLGRQLPKANYTPRIKLRPASYQQKRDTSDRKFQNAIISNHPSDKLIRPIIKAEQILQSKPPLPPTKQRQCTALHSGKKKVKSKPRYMPLVSSPQAVKLPAINIRRNVFSVEASRKKLEPRSLSNKPKVNVTKYKQEDKDQPYKIPFLFNRQRFIIPRYVPVYSRPGRGLERPKVHVMPQWW
jgi:hypothetical protein